MREFNYKEIYKGLLTPTILNLVSAIHECRGKQFLYTKSIPEVLEKMQEVAKIQSTGASNRIEGIITTDQRLQEIVEYKAEPRNRSEQEIAGYREVLALIHENFEHIPVSPSVILQLHRDLYTYNGGSVGGQWKNSDNIIQEQLPDGTRRARFVPVPAFETEEAMRRVCSAYQDALSDTQFDALLLLPIFILDFLSVHPFNDGNGRISRLLTLLMLYREGYYVGRYISIEMLIEKSKESYYDTLYQSSQKWHEAQNDYVPFVQYYLGIVLKAYREFEQRVGVLAEKKLSKGERIQLAFEQTLGKLTKRQLAEMFPDISESTIESTLRKLVKEGTIEKVGSNRYAAYIYKRG